MTITTNTMRRLVLPAVMLCLAWAGLDQARAQDVVYYHTDALGTPVAMTNSSGAVIERRQFEPYGRQLDSTSLQDGPGFAGHVADATTGLVYMQQRYYDPVIGRFDSVDAVTALQGGPQHFNRYEYAYNNPYKFTDPDGRCPEGQECHEAVNQSAGARIARAVAGFLGNFVAGFRSNRTNPLTHEILSPGQAFNARVSALTLLPVARVEGAVADEVAQSTRGLSEARAARNALSDSLAPLKGKAPATVTGGYNVRTGEVAAKACGGGNCAETNVVNALGGNKAEVQLTEAMRPRTGAEVPVCANCESTYGRGAFPPETKFQTDK